MEHQIPQCKIKVCRILDDRVQHSLFIEACQSMASSITTHNKGEWKVVLVTVDIKGESMAVLVVSGGDGVLYLIMELHRSDGGGNPISP